MKFIIYNLVVFVVFYIFDYFLTLVGIQKGNFEEDIYSIFINLFFTYSIGYYVLYKLKKEGYLE